MTLESKINFEKGQRVILNPHNHGMNTVRISNYLKIKDRVGTVVKIEEQGDIDKKTGQFYYGRTGRITLEWDGDGTTRIYKYKNLKIVS